MKTLVVPALLMASVASAAIPTGGSCSKSNDCRSKICFEKRCQPSGDHPEELGGICTSSTHCRSKTCTKGHCVAPPAKAEKSSGKTGGGRSAPVAEEEVEEEAPKGPVEQPLPAATPCSEDLIATVYKGKVSDRSAAFYADDVCKRYKPEDIARGKELYAAGYGRNFSTTLKTLRLATPEQLACAKKDYDKARDEKHPNEFRIPPLCLQKQELIACTKDLAAAAFKGDERDAQSECEKRSPEVIATSKELFAAGFGDSFRAIADVVEKGTAEQLECTKKDYEFRTRGRTKYSSFTLQGVCTREPAVMDCYFDLMSLETQERQYADRNPGDIADMCRNSKPEDVALAKSLRKLGFTQGITSILSNVRDLKPEQKTCLLKLKAAQVTDAEKTEASFRVPKPCYR